VVEVVGGTRTAPETIDMLCAWANALGKAPVVVRRDVRGFVTNRLQYALLREAYALVVRSVIQAAPRLRFDRGTRYSA
jgi:3-hydroxybutyryl-CoA dehydrogenase